MAPPFEASWWVESCGRGMQTERERAPSWRSATELPRRRGSTGGIRTRDHQGQITALLRPAASRGPWNEPRRRSPDLRRARRPATRLFDARPAFGVVRTAGFFAIFDAVTRRTRVLLFLVAAAVLAPSALVAYGMPNGTSRPAPGIPGLPGAVGLKDTGDVNNYPGDAVKGLEVFRVFCAGCHNSMAAGLQGENKPGSDLDGRKPTYDKIVTLIAQGGGGGLRRSSCCRSSRSTRSTTSPSSSRCTRASPVR